MGKMLDGRVVVVTGAAGGIGSEVVTHLANAGAQVVAVSRSGISAPPANIGSIVMVDLRDADAPSSVVESAISAHGRIDGLVNCAAIQPVVELASMSDADWNDVIDTNLTATHRLTSAVALNMVESGRSGSIVHIASIEGTRPAVGHAHYSVAKAGLVMHAKACALEFGAHGIRVNSVSPGLIDRPGLDIDWPEGVGSWTSHAPLGRIGTRGDVAAACLFLLSDMSSWITGTDLVVDGGMSVVQPW